jgi:hypothetical protein
MPAMSIDDVILGDVPEPQPEGHDRIAQVVLEPSMSFEEDVLNDVAGIDPGGQRRVESQVDHAPQWLSVGVEESINGPGLPLPGFVEEILGLGEIAPHACLSAGAEGRKQKAESREGCVRLRFALCLPSLARRACFLPSAFCLLG